MDITRRDARKLFLRQQGLLYDNEFGRGKNGVKKAIERLGYLQIDTISVINRAHEHIMATRVGGFKPEQINRLMQDRQVYEYWSHAAAFMPFDHYRYSLPIMKGWSESRDHDRKLAGEIIRRIRDEGPLQSRHFEDTRKAGGNGWWEWKPAKRALEHLFLTGELMVSHRSGFQKVYDLRENVIPDHVDVSEPDLDEWCEHIIFNMVRALGIGTEYDIGYARPTIQRLARISLKSPMKDALNRLVEEGRLIETELDGMTWYTTSEMLDQLPLRASKRMVKALSPFDNLIINRRRALALFDFDYQLECYVPEPKRKYGYFVLPLLWGDELIGRMDAKAERKTGTLQVRQLYLEDGVRADEKLVAALAAGLQQLAEDNACEGIQILNTTPSSLQLLLEQELL